MIFDFFLWKIKSGFVYLVNGELTKSIWHWLFGGIAMKLTNAFVNTASVKGVQQNSQNSQETLQMSGISMITNETIAIIPKPEIIPAETKKQPPTGTRRDFTQKIISLISYMIAVGEQPILDFVKRSTEEQQRLFAIGRINNNNVWIITDKDKVVTYKDGIIYISGHQTGLSADIYLWNATTNKMEWEWDKNKATRWHRIWQLKYGGKPILEWDKGHFEL